MKMALHTSLRDEVRAIDSERANVWIGWQRCIADHCVRSSSLLFNCHFVKLVAAFDATGSLNLDPQTRVLFLTGKR